MSDPQNPVPDHGIAASGSQPGWVGVVGVAIGLVGLTFALIVLARGWDDLAASHLVPTRLVVAAAAGALGLTTIGLNWIRLVRRKGGSARYSSGLRWYFVGQLGKYIPGGLWAVLGRGELATRGGVERTVSYTSVAVSLATTYGAAATVGALLLAISASSIGARIGWVALSAVTVVGAVAALSGSAVRRISALTGAFGRPVRLPATRPRETLSAIALTMPAWICIGVATAQVANSLGFAADTAQVIAATSYSWLAGFLVIPMPGGLGVREAAFIALYAGTAEEGAAVAVIARVLFVVVDLAGAASSTALDALRRRR